MALEKLIFEKGKSIIDGAKRHMPGKLSNDNINNMVFEICMKDAYLKRQLFRFIDVLPSLKTEKDIMEHLNEYVFEKELNLDSIPGGKHLKLLANKFPKKIVVPTIAYSAKRMANSFISGADIYKTLKPIKQHLKKNMLFTLDKLGEITTSEKDADAYMKSYFHTLDVLADKFGADAKDKCGNPLINVSVKISSLYSSFDPIDPEGTSEGVKKRLRQIFRKAADIGGFVNIDTEHCQYKDVTYKIFKELLTEDEFRNFDHAGIVVQAYLKDSEMALRDLIGFSKENNHPMTIRLVKGAYWDHEVMLAQRNGWDVPVYTKKWQSDANYEKLTDLLIENSKYTHAAIASHNIRNVAYSLVMKDKLGVKPEHFEVQMLYGMGDEIKKSLVQHDIPLRVYMPFGELIPGMGYFVRRLLENSANESFLRAFDSKADPKALLKNPAEFEKTKKYDFLYT